jgi:hypothetical protein
MPATSDGTSLSTFVCSDFDNRFIHFDFVANFLEPLVMVASATLSPILGSFNSNLAILLTYKGVSFSACEINDLF